MVKVSNKTMGSIVFQFLLIVTLLSGSVFTFEMVTVKPKSVSVDEGGSIELFCAVDSYYEWCTFKRHDGKICDFEWKRDLWGLDVLECSEFEGRYVRTGEYDKNECGFKLSNVTLEDAGQWTCELESYHSGRYRGYGYRVNGAFNVDVIVVTTTTTTTTTTTESTTTTTTTTTTSTAVRSETSREYDEEEYHSDEVDQENDANTDSQDSDKPDEESSTMYIVIAVLLLIIIGLFVVLFGLHYKRKLPPQFYTALGRKRWKPVLGNDEYPVTEEDEKKNHPSIVKNGSSNGTKNGTKPSELGPMGDDATVNPSLTTVTWTKTETNGKDVEMKDNKLEEEANQEEEEKKPLQE